MNARTQEFVTYTLENKALERIFCIRSQTNETPTSFSLLASWLLVASNPYHPFPENIVSSRVSELMQQTQPLHLCPEFVCS